MVEVNVADPWRWLRRQSRDHRRQMPPAAILIGVWLQSPAGRKVRLLMLPQIRQGLRVSLFVNKRSMRDKIMLFSLGPNREEAPNKGKCREQQPRHFAG